MHKVTATGTMPLAGSRPGWAAHLPPTSDQLEEIAAVFVAMQPDDGFVDYYKVLHGMSSTAAAWAAARKRMRACAFARTHDEHSVPPVGQGCAPWDGVCRSQTGAPAGVHVRHDYLYLSLDQHEDHSRGASVLVHGDGDFSAWHVVPAQKVHNAVLVNGFTVDVRDHIARLQLVPIIVSRAGAARHHHFHSDATQDEPNGGPDKRKEPS